MEDRPQAGAPVERLARIWHVAIVLVVLLATVVQLALVVRGRHVLVEPGQSLPAVPARLVRFFSYFTVESNLLCAGTSAVLLARPAAASARWLRVLRLNALVGISVTGIIYVTLLRPIVNLSGLPKLTDIAFHYVMPLLMVLGWLVLRLLGSRQPRIDASVLLPSALWPAVYMVWVVIWGAATHWYPYPFTDVGQLGYLTVIRNGLGVTLLLLGLSLLFQRLDELFARRLKTFAQNAGDY